MALNNSTNLYTDTKYVVSSVGATPYTTIQSAINAANAAGIPAKIYIRPGTYTENLTLYSTIFLEGSESSSVKIVGQHTPPTSGSWSATRIEFECTGTDSIIYSTSAGTTAIKFTRCSFIVPNGYIVKAASWTGNITFRYCVGGSSTQNGVVYNTAAAKVEIENSSLGKGTSNAMTVNGILNWNNADIQCPVTLTGTAVSLIQGGSTISGALTVGGDADLQISNSRITSGSAVGITTTSTVVVKLSGVIVDSTNTYAISGTGGIKPSELVLPNSKLINATVTETLTGAVRTGEIFADTLTRMECTGFYSWGGAGNYYDDTTLGSFTVSRPGTGYIKGRLVTWTAPQTVTGMTSGSCWYIYMDVNGTIGKTNAHTDALYSNYIPLFECLYDETPTTKVQYTVKENHPYNFQTAPSNYLHDTVGPVIQNASNGANIVAGSDTVKVGISGDDILSDHGLDTTITTSTGVTWNKMYKTAAGKWARDGAASTDFAGHWNNAGTVATLTGTRTTVYRLYVTKDNLTSTAPQYFAVLNTADYSNNSNALTAIGNGSIASADGELAALELAQLGYITFYSSQVRSIIISKATLKSTTSTSGTSIASLVTTSTTNFDGILSAADTNVQAALETIDEWGKSTTDHALLIGNGTGVAIGSLAVGTTGQVLQGVTSNDPAWSTATYPSTVALGDVLVASGTNVITVANGDLSKGYVLASGGTGTAPSFQSGGFIWNYSSGTNFSCPPNNGYLMNAGTDQIIFVSAVTTFTRTFAIEIIKVTAGYLTIEQQASHQISIAGVLTTAGLAHGVKSNSTGLKRIRLQYVDTNLWYVVATNGSWVTY